MKNNKMLSETIKKLNASYKTESVFSDKNSKKMPSKATVIEIINELKEIVFPGYFDEIAPEASEYYIGSKINSVYEKLKGEIKAAYEYTCEDCDTTERAEKICNDFFEQLPEIQKLLLQDIEAGFNGDPAAKSKDDIIYSYPGLFAIFVYRIAHPLYLAKVPLIARIMTEHAHSRTGIDINSGAEIGKYFFIDHGTGVVIGETTVIGDNVKIYQGVTLGALSTRDGQKLSGVKRHPTIENGVTIYSGATILGGETVIGENAIIGGNCFITHSVPANSTITEKPSELIMKFKKNKTDWDYWEI